MSAGNMDLMRKVYEVIATGNRVEFQVIDIGRFENGKGVEHQGVSDAMSLMMQIGAIAPGAPLP